MSISALEKSVVQLVKGALTLEEYGERLVRASVIETIRIIADLHGLDRGDLEARCVERISASHSKFTTHEGNCKAITYRGKRCTNDALDDGLCSLHGQQQACPTKPSKRAKRAEPPPPSLDPIIAILKSMEQ